MPDWIHIDTFNSSSWNSTAAAYEQQEYEAWRQECIRRDHAMEQILHEEEERVHKERQLIEDKKRYPLFFLKDGIV